MRSAISRFAFGACTVLQYCFARWPSAVPTWAQFETQHSALPNESFTVAVGDFNHDGKLDVAVVGDYLSIFLGNGDGTFKPPVNYVIPSIRLLHGQIFTIRWQPRRCGRSLRQ